MKRISFIFSFVLILCITSGVYTKVNSVNAGTSRIVTVAVKKSKNVKQKQKIINTKKQSKTMIMNLKKYLIDFLKV